MPRRVVVTGMGCVTPLGRNVPELWSRLLRGESAVGRTTLFDASNLPVQISAEVRDWDLSVEGEDPDRWKHQGRHTQFALGAAVQAMRQAGVADVVDPRRFGVYTGDFTGNQTRDIVLTQEIGGTEYPVFGRARLGPTTYPAALRFPTYAGFAAASVEQLFGAAPLRRALHYQTDTFASVYLQNNGDGTFTSVPLPNLAQISPIRGIIVHDVDGDGNLDLIVAGNLYDTEPNTPPADAGNGLWLKGDGRGHFTPVSPVESGFLAPRNVTGLALIQTPAGKAVLVANTGDSLQAFTIRKL